MNRLERLTAILTQLQSKRCIKAQDIADRFGISLRTVYRDMKALEESGVPITAEAGIGYTLVEGYRLPPLMFTKEEALSFLVVEKIYEKITGKGMNQDFQSAMMKIKAVMKHADKSTLEDVSTHIEIMEGFSPSHASDKQIGLQPIIYSLASKKRLIIEYITFLKEERSRRKIEPVGIYYAFDRWYLIAWCGLRKAYRTFRVDRIQQIEQTDEEYPNRHPTLKTYLNQLQKEETLIQVVIHVSKQIAKYLKSQKFNHGFVMEKEMDHHIEMTFMTSSLEGILRWLIIFADDIKIIEPKPLKELMLNTLESMIKNMKE
ncbi:YafY family transcriptional regulator [Belliella sp. DSM 111904]|uniref:YafY family transcriptional regulator n=1 Tax=Belliella filtrata TaxID=2923435 RepID=A0ABS9V5E9_9BACT|nr:YafY family protein [Belliella filtrata]MCH7411634.1 YafY family transcriptional regulator [Belliella filtrata]